MRIPPRIFGIACIGAAVISLVIPFVPPSMRGLFGINPDTEMRIARKNASPSPDAEALSASDNISDTEIPSDRSTRAGTVAEKSDLDSELTQPHSHRNSQHSGHRRHRRRSKRKLSRNDGSTVDSVDAEVGKRAGKTASNSKDAVTTANDDSANASYSATEADSADESDSINGSDRKDALDRSNTSDSAEVSDRTDASNRTDEAPGNSTKAIDTAHYPPPGHNKKRQHKKRRRPRKRRNDKLHASPLPTVVERDNTTTQPITARITKQAAMASKATLRPAPLNPPARPDATFVNDSISSLTVGDQNLRRVRVCVQYAVHDIARTLERYETSASGEANTVDERQANGAEHQPLLAVRCADTFRRSSMRPSDGDVGGAMKMQSALTRAATVATPIDVNQASLAQLEQIPHLRKKTAERIYAAHFLGVRFRTENDLLQIAGITAATVSEIRPYVVFTTE